MQFKQSQTGKDIIYPIDLKKIAKNPKAEIKIVMGAKKGTIKILTIGDIKDIRPKLKIKIGKVRICADKVDAKVVLKEKNPSSGIFFKRLLRDGWK